MATHSENGDWLSIAEQVGEETNPAKLRTLVKQLCSALDDGKKSRVGEKPDSDDKPNALDAR